MKKMWEKIKKAFSDKNHGGKKFSGQGERHFKIQRWKVDKMQKLEP